MGILMEQLYEDLEEAKAFELSFTNFVYDYDDLPGGFYDSVVCEKCGRIAQTKDYMAPKANCRKPSGIRANYTFGVSQELRDELIARFDVTEEDFRPIRSKANEVVYYQIAPRHVMLPFYQVNKWTPKQPCPQCGTVLFEGDDFENEKGEPFSYISQEALDEMQDFNVTRELFSRFFCPKYIISRRVYDFLVEKYPRTHYFPLYLKK